MLVLKILGAVVLLGLIVATLLWRRRDIDLPDSGTVLRPTPLKPPRTFRLLDGSEPPPRNQVELPRIAQPENLVIGERPLADDHYTSPPSRRHDEEWALERSMRRAGLRPSPRRRRRNFFLGTVVIVIVIVAWWSVPATRHHGAPGIVIPW